MESAKAFEMLATKAESCRAWSRAGCRSSNFAKDGRAIPLKLQIKRFPLSWTSDLFLFDMYCKSEITGPSIYSLCNSL